MQRQLERAGGRQPIPRVPRIVWSRQCAVVKLLVYYCLIALRGVDLTAGPLYH